MDFKDKIEEEDEVAPLQKRQSIYQPSLRGKEHSDDDSQDEADDITLLKDTDADTNDGSHSESIYFSRKDWNKNYIFYDDHLEDERYDVKMIEKLFDKSKRGFYFTNKSKRFDQTRALIKKST